VVIEDIPINRFDKPMNKLSLKRFGWSFRVLTDMICWTGIESYIDKYVKLRKGQNTFAIRERKEKWEVCDSIGL
jgi:hypothetical protein